MNQCNDCLGSVQLQQGPPGATGAAGSPGADGAAATIAVGTTTTLSAGSPATVNNSGSSSAATFDFGIPEGADGTDGAALLKSIGAESADYTSASYGPPVIATGDGFPWVVTANTLSTDLDTLRLEGLVLATSGDAIKDLRIQVDSNTVNAGIASYPMSMQYLTIGYKFVIDIIRVSNTQVNLYSDSKLLINTGLPLGGNIDYANSEVSGVEELSVRKNGQSVGSLDLAGANFSVSVDLKTSNAAQPIKLVNCKLLKFKKV